MNFDFKGDPSGESEEERRANEAIAETRESVSSIMESDDECQYCGHAYESIEGCQYCMSNPAKRAYRAQSGGLKKSRRKKK